MYNDPSLGAAVNSDDASIKHTVMPVTATTTHFAKTFGITCRVKSQGIAATTVAIDNADIKLMDTFIIRVYYIVKSKQFEVRSRAFRILCGDKTKKIYTMATKYKRDETDLLSYKVDVLERRIDNIERILLNGQTSKNDVNTELLHMLLEMIKQQNNPTPFVTPEPSRERASSPPKRTEADSSASGQPAERGDHFGFQRRRTII